MGRVGGGFYAEVPLGWVSGDGPGVPFRRPALGLPWGGLVEVGRRWVELGVPWGWVDSGWVLPQGTPWGGFIGYPWGGLARKGTLGVGCGVLS